MEYTKQFDPYRPNDEIDRQRRDQSTAAGDRRDGLVYVYSEEIVLAVNVALATHRPLLVRGPSGSGKSSLARNVALHLGWRYYEDVVSSATQARDLLWRFDSLRRFGDAQVNRLKPNDAYIEPGVLWWAFDPESAHRRGAPDGALDYPAVDPAQGGSPKRPAVVLLDEIDKADPDVPNNLLVPLGSHQFFVTDTSRQVTVNPLNVPLLVITSNDERELPNAFLRRCVGLSLEIPSSKQQLVAVAREHFGPDSETLYDSVAERVLQMQTHGSRSSASTAEYLDTISACLRMHVKPEPADKVWIAILNATIAKGSAESR
jgi:MoxR-like ATPase